VGGPIVGPGCPTVLIGGMPAAVLGDMCICVGPPDTIVLGSSGVLIGGKPAARIGDQCAHGGTIMAGCPTVLIGETGTGSAAAEAASPPADNIMQSAAKDAPAPAKAAKPPGNFSKKSVRTDSIACLVKDEDGHPVPGIYYEIKLPSGAKVAGVTDENGEINIQGIDPGSCTVSFPDLHKDEWHQSQ
jgi:uncharacterized Zn-binding protein involved in type VI secretion